MEAGVGTVQRRDHVTLVDVEGEVMVSVVGTVASADPAQRRGNVERNPADGLGCVAFRATRYGLTHGSLRRRIR